MTTLGTMAARIATELGRGDLDGPIRDAIRTAIRHYERFRLPFNEALASMTTEAGQSAYDAADLPAIADLVALETVSIAENGRESLLTRRPYGYVLLGHGASAPRGRPTDYAYFGQALHLRPIPDRAYGLHLAYVARLPDLAQDGDGNAWLRDGEELVRQRAKAVLWGDVLQNPAQAAFHMTMAERVFAALAAEAAGRARAGRLQATHF